MVRNLNTGIKVIKRTFISILAYCKACELLRAEQLLKNYLLQPVKCGRMYLYYKCKCGNACSVFYVFPAAPYNYTRVVGALSHFYFY